MMPSQQQLRARHHAVEEEEEEAMNLLVRAPAGLRVSLAVDGGMRVEELKARLAQELGVAATEQYLMYQCKPLADAAKLALYGLGGHMQQQQQQVQTVEMGVRTRGGCFIVSFTILTILVIATLCAPVTCGTSLLLYVFLLPPLFVLPFFCL